MRYLQSTGDFYPEAVDYGTSLPDDIIFITNDKYSELISGQAERKVITGNGKNPPRLLEPSVSSGNESVESARLKKDVLIDEATRRILPLQDAADEGFETEQEKTSLRKWKLYRISVNRIDALTAPNIIWPEKPDSY